jgi:hypothetical protein
MHRKNSFLLALLCALIASAFAGQAAHAAAVSIENGSVDWGIRESWRGYIGGGGAITVSGGAQLCNVSTCSGVNGAAPGDFIRFPVVSGSFDEDTHALELELGGAVDFEYAAHGLHNSFSKLHVSLADGLSVVRGDASAYPVGAPTPETWTNVVIVELLTADPQYSFNDPTSIWTSIPSTIAADGVDIFGGFYSLGESMDPVTIRYTGPGGVLTPPEPADLNVTTDPQAQSVTVGSRNEVAQVSFEADADGEDPITVKWQKKRSGEPWADIDGATAKTLTLDVAAADDGTSYHAVFSNDSGSVVTEPAALTVTVVDTEAPKLTIVAPVDGSTTTATTATLQYTVTDNDVPSPMCTLANGATLQLKLGQNKFTLICQDDAPNLVMKTITVTRVEPAPSVPDPAAPVVKNGGTTKLKYKKGRAAKVNLGSVTCASKSTCVYTFTKSIRIKVGKKKFTLKVKGPATLEPGQTGKLTTTIPANVVKAIKKAKKKIRLVVRVTVSNTLKTRHETAKNSISNVR